MTNFTPYTPYVIPSPPQTPSYVKDHLDVLSMDMDPLNLWEKDVLREDVDVSHVTDDVCHVTHNLSHVAINPSHLTHNLCHVANDKVTCPAPLCGSPCSVCTECCCDVCSRDESGFARDSAKDTCSTSPSSAIHSWEDVDVEPLNLAIANTCGKAQVAFALPGNDNSDNESLCGSDTDSLMDSVRLDSSHETYTPSNFLGMSRDAEKMGSDQFQSTHSCEATFVSPLRSARRNLELISRAL